MMSELDQNQNSRQEMTWGRLKSELRVGGTATAGEVKAAYQTVEKKIEEDLQKGFYVWVVEGDMGICGAYGRLGKVQFITTRMYIDGLGVRTKVEGRYKISGRELQVEVEQVAGDPVVGCRAYVDQMLVAVRTSPYDSSGLMADASLRSAIVGRGENPARLDETIKDTISPYPLAIKMLTDYEKSRFDERMTKRMFAGFGDRSTVRWAKDYTFE